jgi:hypothetical protein
MRKANQCGEFRKKTLFEAHAPKKKKKKEAQPCDCQPYPSSMVFGIGFWSLVSRLLSNLPVSHIIALSMLW